MINIHKKLQYRYDGEVCPEVARYELILHNTWMVVFKKSTGLHLCITVEGNSQPVDEAVEQASQTMPWKNIQSVPVNCWFKFKNDNSIFYKTNSIYKKYIVLGHEGYTLEKLHEYFEYTKSETPFDPNIIWLPCGEIE